MATARRISQVTIPEPYNDVDSLRAAVMAIKELVEMLAGQRGDPLNVAVTWDDLVKLSLVKPGRVPKDIGSSTFQRSE